MGFRVWRLTAALAMVAALLAGAAPADSPPPTSTTQAADLLRTGWYADQPTLTPGLVSGGTFGRLFSTPVTGQVYAQPLVWNGTLFVATEANWIYGLDPVTGVPRWGRNVGAGWDPSYVDCDDLSPLVGITGTPVIDPATGTAYFFAKTYASGGSGTAVYWIHAVEVATGDERPGFPVQIQGTAQNAPGVAFDASYELQRPGLLLLDGVVYAAFGGHCDGAPYEGWVVGVSTSGQIKAMWSAAQSPNGGGGIWQSGGGIMSDGSGQIIVTTGNGKTHNGPFAGNRPPANLGNAVVRLQVQPDGTLKPTDFFAPHDTVSLDSWDADLGSGAPMGLPSAYFGTSSYPRLAVQIGKQGYVYLLDLTNLGGEARPGGPDLVVNRLGHFGGVWSKPGVWPGDGGYVYIPTASDGHSSPRGGNLLVFQYGLDAGKPTLALVSTSTDSFGFGTSSPIVTSDGTTHGSALVWVVWSPSAGGGAELRAYDPVPVAGQLPLRWSAAIGTATKFALPGVANGRIYVGTRGGQVLGFGAPVNTALASPGVVFPQTTIGNTSARKATFTASSPVTITAFSSSNTDDLDVGIRVFTLGTPSRALPAALSAGQSISVPVTFAPTDPNPGLVGRTLDATTNLGQVTASLSGIGAALNGNLSTTPGRHRRR